ncbi:MAG: 4-hydroxy-tetrahydrodipicolinate synthase [Rhodocyclaceae bacterium]|jgi:4-hydroxy-tetrahydrodipicolinate synthase|nr:4-hydroxy-tetrahydrodipicolinate synthase [Rhodocyclaceae bacterium]
MIQGSIVALVTPMQEDGSLDYAALDRLVDWHVAEGTDAIVVVGTTGESPTVDVEEHCALIAAVVKRAAGRVPVIAGTGANSTREAVELAEFARKAGADAHLSVVPYYNKPTQEGQYLHFRTIAEAVELPMILYNVPGRTVADLSNDTAIRLADVPNIIGIKDATGDINRGTDLLLRAPVEFAVYSGDDPTAAALMLFGGKGCISISANLAPRLMHEMCAAAIAREVDKAVQLNYKLLPLHRAVLVEPNPIPAKWALSKMGKIPAGIRLPLVPMTDASVGKVTEALTHAGIVL